MKNINNINNYEHEHTGQEFLNLVKKDISLKDSALNKYIKLNLIASMPQPPSNSSDFTKNELQFIKNNITRSDSDFKDMAVHVHDLPNFYEYWSRFANEELNADLDASYFENHASKTDGLINWVKLQFMRPRPYALAREMGMSFDLPADERYTTASYPSGHSCESYIFGYLLSEKYPEHNEKILLFTRDLANSRIVAGVHFPSDIIAGKILANQIFSNNLCNYN